MNDQPAPGMEAAATTSEDRFSERLESIGRRAVLQRVLDSLYGYDYFISYRWSDGRIYAVALAEQLQRKGFNCFLDSEDYLKGDNWKRVGEHALKKTTRLVLVGSPEVHQSGPVLRELQIFTAEGKRVIPINFDTSLSGPQSEQSPLAPYLDADAIWIAEPLEKLSEGPSADTVEQLEKSFTKARQSQKRKRAFGIAAAAFCLLIGLAIWYARDSYNKQTVAMVRTLTTDLVENDASSTNFEDLFAQMSSRSGAIVSALSGHSEEFQPSEKDEDDRFAKQRANAAIVLVRLGEYDLAKEFLYLQGSPAPLAQFAARCKTPGGLTEDQLLAFATHLIDDNRSRSDEALALVGYSALLGLGEYSDPDDAAMPKAILTPLKKWYQDHPHPAIHSACGWLLGREAANALKDVNKDLAVRPQPLDLKGPYPSWFVIKLDVEDAVEYLTFVHLQDDIFISDREATVGICGQLASKSLTWPANPLTIEPIDKVKTFAQAEELCKAFSEQYGLHVRLPSPSEWAVAWGNPLERKDRAFQFGNDVSLLPRYAKIGKSERGSSRPDPVATHCPSATGMFDMHGNVAEWTSSETLRGGAVGQLEQLCRWNDQGIDAVSKGIRFVIDRVGND